MPQQSGLYRDLILFFNDVNLMKKCISRSACFKFKDLAGLCAPIMIGVHKMVVKYIVKF